MREGPDDRTRVDGQRSEGYSCGCMSRNKIGTKDDHATAQASRCSGLTARTLIVSDVHGNAEALRAIVAHEPVEKGVAPGCRPQFEWLADATYPIGHAQLTGEERGYLATLPRWVRLERDHVRYGLVHATPRDPLYAYLDSDPEAWEEQRSSLDVDVLLVGHTHLQFDLRLRAKRVVNPGSAGQPKDGDARAAYAVLDAQGIRLGRVVYSVERTIEALADTGVAPLVVEDLAYLLRTGTPRKPHGIPAPP
jgi:diadenosine tetraphosphatase ApaH/serine/threonine PP2A family protein phosphatase